MKLNDGKLSSGNLNLSSDLMSRPVGSHDVALARPQAVLQMPQEVDESNFSEYHLTARISNSSLVPRELSLILSVLNYQIVNFGCNFPMFLTLVELTMRLSSGRHPDEISDSDIRLTVLVSETLIQYFKGVEFTLDSKVRLPVEGPVRNILVPYLMDSRTYGSRFVTWRPEKFVKIRAVPVSILIERNSSSSKRYSAYCKGYGESHGNAHKFKTRPSDELDGEKVPDKAERNLILRMANPDHQKANQLSIKLRNLSVGD